MRYKIWYSGNKRVEEAWAVEEITPSRPQRWVCPAVQVYGPVTFVAGDPEVVPKAWAEAEGYAAIDGSTNAIVIRPDADR